jgi:cell division septation protein DedD
MVRADDPKPPELPKRRPEEGQNRPRAITKKPTPTPPRTEAARTMQRLLGI